jgi:Holliday junction resolvasome RuvABC DNA-binding subunit
MSIMTTRRHAEISDLSPKKVSPDPPPKIRHAATALTGMGYSVAATIGAIFVSATPTKNATSIETCLVIRNTGDHEAYGFQDFVAALRQF